MNNLKDIINTIKKRYLTQFFVMMLLMICHVPEASALGHIASDGNCYGYYIWYENYPPVPVTMWAHGIRYDSPYSWVFVNTRFLTTGLDRRLVYGVYKWQNGNWIYVTEHGAYTNQALIDEIMSVIGPYGASNGVYPHSIMPNGCTTTCQDEELKLREKCGEENYYFDPVNCEGCCSYQANSAGICLAPSSNFGPPNTCH